MKKIYNAPQAGLLCFRPVEGLANDSIEFDKLLELNDTVNQSGKATVTSENDIFIPIG